jgi:nitroreductase
VSTPFDLSQTDKLLTTTRAVRKRLDLGRQVSRDVVLDCIRVACQAPAGGNYQRWRWVVIDDADRRAALAALYKRAFEPYMAIQRQALEGTGDPTINDIIDSSTYLAEHLHEVPVHVVPCMLDRVQPDAGLSAMAGYFGSILPAVWSFQLALRSRGLGSAWTTLHLDYEEEAAELLGIPTTVSQVALIPVAYYRGDDFRPGARRPAEEVTYWNGWKGVEP